MLLKVKVGVLFSQAKGRGFEPLLPLMIKALSRAGFSKKSKVIYKA
jgi:hypothetical protein